MGTELHGPRIPAGRRVAWPRFRASKWYLAKKLIMREGRGIESQVISFTDRVLDRAPCRCDSNLLGYTMPGPG